MFNIYKMIIFSFEKELNVQMHSSADANHLIKKSNSIKISHSPSTREGIFSPHPLTLFGHKVHPSLSAGGFNLLPNFEKGGVWQDLKFESEVAGKKGAIFFRLGCNFYRKNKLKSEIFNDKESFQTKTFSLS